MEYMAWMGWFVSLAAMGSASLALKQIASLKQEIEILKAELRRRGLVEHAVGQQKIILPDSISSK